MLTLRNITHSNAPQSKRVLCNGRNIGEVVHTDREYGGSGWHAILNVEQTPGVHHTSLVQGHGDDPTSAVHAAFVSSRRESLAYLERLRELEAELFDPESGASCGPIAPINADIRNESPVPA